MAGRGGNGSLARIGLVSRRGEVLAISQVIDVAEQSVAVPIFQEVQKVVQATLGSEVGRAIERRVREGNVFSRGDGDRHDNT